MTAQPLQIGRYVLHDEIAAGGMAKVHIGRASGALGFSKIVAIKRILPHLLGQQEFVEMFVDETRVAARIQHPNVVSTLDAVVTRDEVFLVMEYVLGESAARLFRLARKRSQMIPVPIAVAIVCGTLRGLHAAHEARNDSGEVLGVVHRDVSPQNVIVGADGATRVIDFGVAKARGRLQTTREGQIKGKLSYMSPEQLSGHEPDRRTDVYAAGVILWEALTGQRLHVGDNDAIVYSRVMNGVVALPSSIHPAVSPALDAIVMRAINRNANERYGTAEQMLLALEAAIHPASPHTIGAWVRELAGDLIDAKAARIAEIEKGVYISPTPQNLIPESGSMPSVSTGPTKSDLHAPAPSDISSTAFGRSAATHAAPSKGLSGVQLATIIVAIVGCLMASVIIVVFVRRPARPVAAAVASSAPPPPPVVSAVEPAVVPEEPAPPPSATADGPHDAGQAAAVKPVTPVAPVVRPKPKSACEPPWFLDAKGIKRFKPECM